MSIEFKNSPLNEVIFGIQLKEPLLTSNHIIDIINIFKSNYPEISEHPTLPAIVENPNKPNTLKQLSFFSSRKHLIHKEKNKLIQIQPDKLWLNWRKEENSSPYPRFKIIFNEFKKIINDIIEMIDFNFYTEINQFEFTYIDHIYLDLFNIDSYQLSHILNICKYDAQMKNFNIEYSIPQENIGGTLNTSIKSAKNKINDRKLFVFENTCRGYRTADSIDAWFKNAHEILIKNFLNILSDKAKDIWGYKER